MSKSLTAFLAGNAEPLKNTRYVASERFKDENGEFIEWVIRPVTSAENEALKKRVRNGEVDNDDILLENAILATVYPNLKDTELQKSYGVVGEAELLQALLPLPGEYYGYLMKVNSVLGYNKTPRQRVDEAKN